MISHKIGLFPNSAIEKESKKRAAAASTKRVKLKDKEKLKRRDGDKNSGRYKSQAVYQQDLKRPLHCLPDATPFDDLSHHGSLSL